MSKLGVATTLCVSRLRHAAFYAHLANDLSLQTFAITEDANTLMLALALANGVALPVAAVRSSSRQYFSESVVFVCVPARLY